jgi:hypothetical protein
MFDVGLHERLLIPSFPACGTLQSVGAIDDGRPGGALGAPKPDIVICVLCVGLVFVCVFLLVLVLGLMLAVCSSSSG